MKKKKYAKTDFYLCFHDLLKNLAVTVDPDAFIALQDALLADIGDKNSGEATVILQRKIDFYQRLHQPDKAWALIEENIQIESFRQEVTEKKIAENDFQAAKKLINDIIEEKEKIKNSYVRDSWHKMLLDIAQKENDLLTVRKLAYGFIKDRFDVEYYKIYKAAFDSIEWADAREKLFLNYDNNKYVSDSAAELLAEEKETERLMQYVEKHLSIENLENYYRYFASAYPEKTLGMFEEVLVPYADQYTGRNHYERILSALKEMSGIKGGKKVASNLVADFRIHYKNRRAMMEILEKF
jgi:hypothetical protein